MIRVPEQLHNTNILGISFEIEIYYTGENLIEHIRCGSSYDFLILDIELTSATGIDVGKYLRDVNRNFHSQIIYISSKDTYAMKLFSVQPLDFIVKPIKEKQLLKAIKRGLEIIGNGEDFFSCKVGKGNITLNCKDILYLSSNKRIISVVCSDDDILNYYGKLSHVINELPNYFAQIHSSYIINLNAIKKCNNAYVILNNGEIINISRKFSESFKRKILSRWKSANCED